MNALVFAAGLGTRLRPLTLDRPKALVEVGGEPMLGRVIRRLAAAGVDRVVVNNHHFSNKVKSYLAANDFGVETAVSDESDLLLDTGGGLLKARRLLDDGQPFFVHNADIFTDLDLAAMAEAHRRSGAGATLLVQPRRSSRQLLFDRCGRLMAWENIKTGEVRPAGAETAGLEPLAFGGIHILSPSVFEPLSRYSSEPVFPIVPFYVDNAKKIDIRAYLAPTSTNWFDIGNPEKLEAARQFISSRP